MYLTTFQQILQSYNHISSFTYKFRDVLSSLLIDFQPRVAPNAYYFCLLPICHIIDNTSYIRGTHI